MSVKPLDANATITHRVDVCVVGGGMSGICAAMAAARHGASVMLVHDRPVFGGNSSSECRMHICGADRHNSIPNMRETGILEELRLENLRRNPTRSYPIWDSVLYDALICQDNLEFLLNCSVQDAESRDGRVVSVTGWQLTTYQYHCVKANVFIDCSGDGILAPLVGAEFRKGREGRHEYNESIAPELADEKTMGMTCMFQAVEHDRPMPFEPPTWAETFTSCDQLRGHQWIEMGYWWIELGGEDDSIADTERLRHELLKITYGIWDHIKNHCKDREKAANWALDWIQFLPAKRESRRFIGAHVLSQNEVAAGGTFDDIVAYGGWTMDDHDPSGFRSISRKLPSTIFHQAPVGFGIPYGSLYSRNIANLMFAGRNASCTHTAMSSTRVMGTCSAMGQAAGTAAAMAAEHACDPSDIASRISELQARLLRDDCYLLAEMPMSFSDAMKKASVKASSGDPTALLDGITRPVGDEPHSWSHRPGDSVEVVFDSPGPFTQATLVLDSMLEAEIQFSRHYGSKQLTAPPPRLQRDFTIEVFDGTNWSVAAEVEGNYQRLVRIPLCGPVKAMRYTLKSCWSEKPDTNTALYAFYAD